MTLAVKPPQDGVATSEATPGAPAVSRNVWQRKLAVMKRCSAIVPDKRHPHHGFEYVSIQALENHLREFLVAEGLDVTATLEDGSLVLILTNVDQPTDQIVSRWPIVAEDKGWAYTVKYPLMRTFHVGDGDEGDEKEMADRSARTASAQVQRAETHTPERPATVQPASPGVAGEAIALFNRLSKDEQTKRAAWNVLTARELGEHAWQRRTETQRGSGPPHSWIPTLPVEVQERVLKALRVVAGAEIDDAPRDPFDQEDIPW